MEAETSTVKLRLERTMKNIKMKSIDSSEFLRESVSSCSMSVLT